MKSHRLAILVAAIVGLSASLALGSLFKGDSSGLRPLHAIHAEEGLECSECHVNGVDSTMGSDELRPDKSLCADCHDVEDEAECGLCHTSTEDPTGYAAAPAVAQVFSHAVHAAEGMTCSECHGEGAQVMSANKTSCRSCHATSSGLSDCSFCHAEGENLTPISHGPQWLSFHAVEGRWDEPSCMNCHTQTDCQDCHNGDNVRPRSHELDYMFRHALDAKSNELQCASCHFDPDYCSSCHIASRVLPENHSRGDWLLSSTGGRHAVEAAFEIEQCVACHDTGMNEPMCAECHGR